MYKPSIAISTVVVGGISTSLDLPPLMLHMWMGFLGCLCVVVLTPLALDKQNYGWKQVAGFFAISLIFSYIIFVTGEETPHFGVQWLDAIFAFAWKLDSGIRCFLVGAFLPKIVGALHALQKSPFRKAEK